MSVPLLDTEHRWACPNCPATAVTTGTGTRMHTCPGLHGVWAPMIPAGTTAKVTVLYREDYQGTALTQNDENGRPVMAVNVERPTGNDVVVLAPCVQVGAKGIGA